MSALGRLVLLPVPLDPDQSPLEVLPPATRAHFERIDVFVVENAKAARRFLKPLVGDRPLQSLELVEWNANQRRLSPDQALAPLRRGADVGLLSDAGCPAVADPGADLVAAAHRMGARVVPAIGPSALLLALMASGMGGQRFAFVGYLPSEGEARKSALRELERRSARDDETLLFIETPYRNHAMIESALECLAPDTIFMSASGLSLASERIVSRPVAQWRKAGGEPPVDRRIPAVFALKAPTRPRRAGSAKARRGTGVEGGLEHRPELRGKLRADLPRKPLGD
jgi:16S rRNA (cytidine1402-2'-O)-methyltransferase